MTKAEERFEKIREELRDKLGHHTVRLIEDFIFACIEVERENQK